MKRRIGQAALLVVCVRLAFGCASIIHGTTQDINISSSPDSAEVWIDGIRMTTTPGRVTLSRKNDYTVVIKKEGYRTVTARVEGTTSAWLIGNLVFGGIIGCAIDLIAGGAYDLKPERLDFNLTNIAELDGKTIRLDRATMDSLKEMRFLDGAGNPEIVVQIAGAE